MMTPPRDSLAFQLESLVEHPPDDPRRWRAEFMESRIKPTSRWSRLRGRAHRRALLRADASGRRAGAPGAPLYRAHPRHPPCKEGKFARLLKWLRESNRNLEGRHFYSDSHNDLPLLETVDSPVAVAPDPALAAHAEARDWPILRLHG